MKKACTIFTLLVAFTAACLAQSWMEITPAISNEQLEDVFFISPVKGWAVGAKNTILTTNDGGNTWTSQTSPLSASAGHLNGVWFNSPTIGWILSSSDTVLTTIDGGTTWIPKEIPGVYKYNDIQFVSADTGFLVGENGTQGVIKRTFNGGATWQTATTPKVLYGAHFANSHIGYATGYLGFIYGTTNAGATWVEQKAGGATIANNLYAVFMLSPAEGWVAGNTSSIWYTTDSGQTWTSRNSGTNAGKKAVHFFDSQRGWLGTTSSLGGAKPLRSSIDSGKTWVIDTIFTSSVHALAFSGDTLGWAVGENGIILRMGTPPAVGVPSAIGDVTNAKHTLKVYPNPTSNTLNITGTLAVERYTVTNLLGETVLSGEPTNAYNFQLHTATLPRGTYLVCTVAQGRQYFTRFVRN